MKPMSMILGCVLAVGATILSAATTDVSLSLKPGWNAVYTPIASELPPDELFEDWPVPSVSLYNAREFLATSSNAGGLTGEMVSWSPFFIWMRDAPSASTLLKVVADSVLVCCNTGSETRTVHFRGKPAAPRIAWHCSSGMDDSLNFVGVGLNPGVKVYASAYFAGCPSVKGGTFYQLAGKEDSYIIRSMTGLSSTASAQLTDGMAVLVPGVAISEWAGPLTVSPRGGIDFGESRTVDELMIANTGVGAKTVELQLLPSSDGMEPLDLLVRDVDAAIVNSDWKPFHVNGLSLTKTLSTGETWRISVALDRAKLKETADCLGAVLRISEVGGTQMRVRLPIVAQNVKGKDAWPCGLWAVDLELDKVSRYVTDAECVDDVQAGGRMNLRIYIHVGADGLAHLLPRVTVAGVKHADGSITRMAYGPEATLPSGLDYARRLSSAALPVDLAALAPAAGSEWGVKVAFSYRIAAKSPSNPFRHPLHPMFDGKDANFEPLPYDGDDFSNYAKAVKPELFSLGGEIVLSWDGKSNGVVWSPSEALTGTCQWIYTGLMRQGPVKASGTFTAERVVPAVPLIIK